MKATYALLSDFTRAEVPFLVKRMASQTFSKEFHFHRECQLVYVMSGSGTRIIGQSIEQYEEGDLTFVGPNVPHVWNSKPSDNPMGSVSLALYVNLDSVTNKLAGLINTSELSNFLIESERGIKICGRKKALIVDILKQMPNQQNISLLASFVKILDYLLDPKDLLWLNSPDLIASFASEPPGRVRKLMDYIQENFREEITLRQAASICGLEVHSFCRFFKTLTNRTFSDFINEVRIAFARKLLKQTELPITQIAYECGYTNLCYFNRSFKKINKISPKAYRSFSMYHIG